MRFVPTFQFSFNYLVLLGVLLFAPQGSQARPIFEAVYGEKTVHCSVEADGSIVSGRLKGERFKKDRSIKSLRKKLRRAKRAGDVEKVRKLRRKLKRMRARRRVCTEKLLPDDGSPQDPNQDTPPGDEPPGSNPPGSTPPDGTPPQDIPPTTGVEFTEFRRVIDLHCVSCHMNFHSSWASLGTEDAWLAAKSNNQQPLINQNDLPSSLLLQRLKFYGASNSTMPLPNLNSSTAFTVNEYAIIRGWIYGFGDNPDPGNPNPGNPNPENPNPDNPNPGTPNPDNPDPGVQPPNGSDERRGNDLTSAEVYSCTGSPQPSDSRIRRIGQLEWATSLGLQATEAVFNPLVANADHQFSTFSELETIDDTVLNEYFNHIERTSTGWTDGSSTSGLPRPPEHKCMIASAPPTTECITDFLEVYLKNFVLFRTPRPGELSRLVSFAEEAVAEGERSTKASRSEVMKQITSAAWLTTGALFRSEVGQGETLANGDSFLSDEELGKALAYTLTDQGPGAPNRTYLARIVPALERIQDIEDAVLDGSISSPSTLDSLVEANFSGVDSSRDDHYSEYWLGEKVEQFFIEWLGLGSLSTTFHDTPSATADTGSYEDADKSFNHQKATAYYGKEITLVEQAVEMIAKIVNDDQQVLRNLLTSRNFYVPSNLESSFKATESPQLVYGVTANVAANRSARWRTLPADERSGILTHPAWLAAHSDNFENGPSAVLRGKWVRENMLCGIVPDVPITVDASFPPSTDHLSARERLGLATSQQFCQGCHSLMNPLGLPFEIYNHAGFKRATDHGASPNGTSDIIYSGDPALDGQVTDAVEFSQRLADSALVEQCFVRQVFRFFMGRLEKAEDACTLTMMRDTYQQTDGSMKAMIQALIKSPAFIMRKSPTSEE